MHDAPNCLVPTLQEQIARATGDLRMGLPCLLHHRTDRCVVVAIELLAHARFEAMLGLWGTPELVLTAQRATAVMTPAAASNVAASPVRICPPDSAGLDWYKGLADTRFDKTGKLAGPLHMLRTGDTTIHRLAIELVKKAELLPAVAVFSVPADDTTAGLSMVPLHAAPALKSLADQPPLLPVAAAALPLEAHDASQLHVFRDPVGRAEHYALEIGTPDRSEPVLSRLHSACFTGDVLGSLKCDCGPQLRTALARIGQEGAGVLLYLNQEGRGIGLANKMRVYDLQSQGLDTVEANHRLGFDDDERDYRVAANILRTLGFGSVRLLTNNPTKVEALETNGITVVERLPLRVARNVHNQHYLAIKAQKSGHSL